MAIPGFTSMSSSSRKKAAEEKEAAAIISLFSKPIFIYPAKAI